MDNPVFHIVQKMRGIRWKNPVPNSTKICDGLIGGKFGFEVCRSCDWN
jgi:hypothetical protein